MGKAIEITDGNFNDIISSDKPVVVDFWAEWCGPCKMIAPLIEELAGSYEGKAIIGKLNVDENPNVSRQFGVTNIPTLLFLKNGKTVDKLIGMAPRSVLVEKLEKAI
ncbi:MAG: thioredoxin [Candidatus Nephrothrix sp. EaCA]|nr:MAG: thioredoxin [Candidatus Nephrothrix sp. EaCA]